MSSLAVSSTVGSPISISGLASGLNTSSIISALMAVERQPVTHLTDAQEKLQGQQKELTSVKSSLQQLALLASEFSMPSLFETSQAVVSSEPLRVSAATSAGAGIGGYELEVKQLANSAQRTFTFASPAAEETLTIDGNSFTVKAGETAKEFANTVNSTSSSTVYAAVLEGNTLVLSNRATGNTGAEFIKVSDPGTTLVETAGSAKEGKNAEYSVDGVAGTSTSNTVTNAIAGVTLTLNGLTTTGPVTIDVQAPGASVSAVEAQVQSFVKLYNSTVETIQKQLSTKPIAKPKNAGEFATGTLFGDVELEGLLGGMRQSMYAPIAGLAAEMSNPSAIGISTGAASGGGASQGSIEGLLTLNSTKLSEAVKTNPAGVQQMLEKWSQGLQSQLEEVSGPGGSLEARANGDSAQITQLTSQISTMNEMLAVREKALQATYAALESAISRNTSQANWLSSQEASLLANHP